MQVKHYREKLKSSEDELQVSDFIPLELSNVIELKSSTGKDQFGKRKKDIVLENVMLKKIVRLLYIHELQ